MLKHWRVPFAVLVMALIGMWWFVGAEDWNSGKDQRNKMRRYNATLRERVTVLEQRLTTEPNSQPNKAGNP